ncbi:MAG: hypothetical protein ABIH87_03715 [bacterium]|nr:hypothetical protein [Patescibacteria group bacterium]
MKNFKKIILGVIIMMLLGLAFYWYSYRPSQIVKECSFISKEAAIKLSNLDGKYQPDDRDVYYKYCLQKKGLVK